MTALYRPAEAISVLRSSLLLPRMQPSSTRRARAAFSTTRNAHAKEPTFPGTPFPEPARKSITLTGDTGRVRWTELSPGEKVVRTTQQSFNLLIVAVGVIATGGVAYFLFSDVFSPNSKTAYFNEATTKIRQDPRCQKLLGEGSQIAAFGEGSWSRYAKNRFISSTEETDKWGTDHLKFRFFVEGNGKQGVVHVHLIKKPSMATYEYAELTVDVKGHRSIDLAAKEKQDHVAPKIFGARWW
ncbi:import inner membrane translocase subunit tim-21, mitochondrial [Didymella exigua CBS 183.55]|uniref:Mitochondrial import inner membrane translocase subunit Tim21 n=1 Tax=Didymella exigua CBS 183.55 TaxID=1150837 RepID=A0A6A5R5J1_9PLEO|nr:import inner membrane translocase subunit tim-21, mitochondrial [Didymella exigua CBS 183.55]KAF1922428.1 import inner membrane translocase subunit tim-21, mitochondrial [Didymella exigua CBS 183.55]